MCTSGQAEVVKSFLLRVPIHISIDGYICEIVLMKVQHYHTVTPTLWQGVYTEKHVPKSVPQVIKSYYVSCQPHGWECLLGCI